MKCPNDNATLQMTDRNGIEIDYCPECRGIWLDRGELDKLIERTSSHYNASPAMGSHTQPQASHSARFDDDDDDYHRSGDHHRRDERHYDSDDHHHGHKKKKEGFLGDLFDF